MKKSLIAVLLFSNITGCSTIFNSNSQTITALAPSGQKNVEVMVNSTNGSYPATLPAIIVAEPSYNDVSIKVTDTCYSPTLVKVNKHITPSFWANLIIWPGFLVDALTGRYLTFDSTVNIPLQHTQNCTK